MFERTRRLVGCMRAVVGGTARACRPRAAVGGTARALPTRRLGALLLILTLLSLSGYLAAAGGVTLFDAGGAADAGPAGSGPATAAGPATSDGAAVDSTQAPGIVGPAAGATDPDGDRLATTAERERYGTDPTVADTDGDGYPDGMEVGCAGALPDADPTRQDVYVELDSVEGVTLTAQTRDQLRQQFADAPVENVDGSRGISLHLVESDDGLPQGETVNNRDRDGAYNDVGDYRAAHADGGDAGYYYLLVTTDVAYDGDDYYAGAGRNGVAVVESYDRSDVMTSLSMHELGHAFGISHDQDGVDERAYAVGEYESVMNYNALYEVSTYSDGSDEVGRDEWAFVANDRYRPAVATDGDALCPPAP